MYDEEFKLPKTASTVIILTANLLLQISFFIIVSSSNAYAEALSGDSVFAGVVIGIPTVFAGLALLVMRRYDRGHYKVPLHISCGTSIVGHILYALAYKAQFLYLILIGRMVSGLSFSMWMYCKRYCSDGRIVGMRRRTTLACWLVLGQGLGMSAGPFFGGLLTKLGTRNAVFNGYTSPEWIMTCVWVVFWGCVYMWFEDIEDEPMSFEENPGGRPAEQTLVVESSSHRTMSPWQWGVIGCMCWSAMTCFFILGAWEASIPVYMAGELHLSLFGAGNFLALGGITTCPLLILNLCLAKRIEDRQILHVGLSIGISGLLVFICLLATNSITYWGMFACWWLVALGFNLASTVTVSLLSKQLPQNWNGRTSLWIQFSNYTGRVSGAIWGSSSVVVGTVTYAGLEIGIAGTGLVLAILFWSRLKTKTG